jgi:ribosomal protein L22
MSDDPQKPDEVEETPAAEEQPKPKRSRAKKPTDEQQQRADEAAARAADAAEEAAEAAEEAATPTAVAGAEEAEELAEKAEEAAEAAAEAPKRARSRKAREAEQAAEEAEEAAEEAVESAKRSRARRKKAADEEPAEAAKPAKPAKPARRKRDERAPVPVGLTVRAQAKYVRTSARKARLVCDHIRGKDVAEARAILAFTPRGAAKPWLKLLESAVANAEHNHELVGEELRIASVHADEGPTLKRFRPRAMGRATRIRKRTSHLTITLTPKES